MAASLFGSVAKSTGSFLVGQVKDQMVSLIEQYEPTLEAGLRDKLTKLRVSNPTEAALFLQNWKKLDRAVVESLSVSLGGKRRTKRTKRHSRK